mgnify:CR=1 FL=1
MLNRLIHWLAGAEIAGLRAELADIKRTYD